MKIGFIGLGIMGSAMCANIIHKHDDAVYVFIEDSIYLDTIIQVMSKTLKLDKSCYIVKVIDRIPKSPSGKIDYLALKEMMTS